MVYGLCIVTEKTFMMGVFERIEFWFKIGCILTRVSSEVTVSLFFACI